MAPENPYSIPASFDGEVIRPSPHYERRELPSGQLLRMVELLWRAHRWLVALVVFGWLGVLVQIVRSLHGTWLSWAMLPGVVIESVILLLVHGFIRSLKVLRQSPSWTGLTVAFRAQAKLMTIVGVLVIVVSLVTAIAFGVLFKLANS